MVGFAIIIVSLLGLIRLFLICLVLLLIVFVMMNNLWKYALYIILIEFMMAQVLLVVGIQLGVRLSLFLDLFILLNLVLILLNLLLLMILSIMQGVIMAISSDFRYLCTMKGRTLYVHGVASVDRLRHSRLPYKWTYAITESYMNKLVDDKKVDVVWYQKEFDFDS